MAKLKKEISLTGISVDRASDIPVYKQIYHEFRSAILAGRFLPGEQLPPTRDLSRYLGVSRTTIVLSFDHLMLEGYIKGRQGAGTYISDDIPEDLLYANRAVDRDSPSGIRKESRTAKGADLTRYLERERSQYGVFAPFKPGVPDLNAFPFRLWGKLLSTAANEIRHSEFGYISSAGYKPLREAIANYVRIARGVRCHAGQVIMTSGAQQGINIVHRVLLSTGDAIGFEDPGYPDAQAIFSSAGMEIAPMPMDREGINFKASKKKPVLIYVTPSHHYPLGITMSLNRRLELLDYANRIGAWILEDDYDSEYRYNGLPISSLQGIDNSDSVIYMGTFSKVMFPGIRLGYLIVPDSLRDAFVAARLLADRHSPVIEQAAPGGIYHSRTFWPSHPENAPAISRQERALLPTCK